MSIIMTGGGTGGHLAIIRAVKEQLVSGADKGVQGSGFRVQDRDEQLAGSSVGRGVPTPTNNDQDQEDNANQRGQVIHDSSATPKWRADKSQITRPLKSLIYVGSTKGQDRQWFGDDGDFSEKYFFDTAGVVNQKGLSRVKSLWMIAAATIRSIGIIRRHKAGVVFSVGGFSAAPMAVAAKLTRTPLVIHEQNAALGSLNKLLKPFATKFISSYLDESPIHAYPIKEVFFDNARIRDEVKTIIFLGGSQGAQAINRLALELAPTLRDRGIRIIHQAGERNIDDVRSEYEKLGIEAEVFGFTTRLAEYMTEADFAIARAGASTLWELSANALPTLYIPYPYAASDHQYYNAQFLVAKELAWLMREDKIEPAKVLELLEEDMNSRSRGLMDVVERDGAEQIAELLRSFDG